jgi:hypothetical protein
MNCREFRRQLLIDPNCAEPEFLEHETDCPECAREHERAQRFEQRLKAALRTDAPDHSKLRRPSNATAKPRGGQGSHRLALAASLVLALAVGWWLELGWQGRTVANSDLGQVVLQHIEDEINHLQDEGVVQPAAVAYLVSQFGGRLVEDLGQVSYLGRCHIRRWEGIHLVVHGRAGAVTVLLMPEEYRREPERVSSGRFSGVILPTSNGSMAVIGEKAERVEDLGRRIRAAIRWDV